MWIGLGVIARGGYLPMGGKNKCLQVDRLGGDVHSVLDRDMHILWNLLLPYSSRMCVCMGEKAGTS